MINANEIGFKFISPSSKREQKPEGADTARRVSNGQERGSAPRVTQAPSLVEPSAARPSRPISQRTAALIWPERKKPEPIPSFEQWEVECAVSEGANRVSTSAQTTRDEELDLPLTHSRRSSVARLKLQDSLFSGSGSAQPASRQHATTPTLQEDSPPVASRSVWDNACDSDSTDEETYEEEHTQRKGRSLFELKCSDDVKDRQLYAKIRERYTSKQTPLPPCTKACCDKSKLAALTRKQSQPSRQPSPSTTEYNGDSSEGELRLSPWAQESSSEDDTPEARWESRPSWL